MTKILSAVLMVTIGFDNLFRAERSFLVRLFSFFVLYFGVSDSRWLSMLILVSSIKFSRAVLSVIL